VRQIFPCSAHLTGNTNTVGSFRHQLREIGQRWLLAASAHPGQTQMVCFGVSSGTGTCRLSDGDSWAKAALHWTEAEAMHLTLERIAADDWFFSNETHSCRCIHFERHCLPCFCVCCHVWVPQVMLGRSASWHIVQPGEHCCVASQICGLCVVVLLCV
jgi:hypothetical protein